MKLTVVSDATVEDQGQRLVTIGKTKTPKGFNMQAERDCICKAVENLQNI